MKTQLVLFIGAAFALFLSSCTVIVDGNNRPCGIAQQPIRVGTFGPNHGRPLNVVNRPGQHMLVQGSLRTNSLCDPRGLQVQGGIRVNRVPQRWGQVNPFGPRCYPQHGRQQPPPMFGYPPQQNFNRAGPGQANWCPPNYGPQPACFDPFTGRWR